MPQRQMSWRNNTLGYLSRDLPLPAGVTDREICEQYPNHLYDSAILLRLSDNGLSPPQIYECLPANIRALSTRYLDIKMIGASIHKKKNKRRISQQTTGPTSHQVTLSAPISVRSHTTLPLPRPQTSLFGNSDRLLALYGYTGAKPQVQIDSSGEENTESHDKMPVRMGEGADIPPFSTALYNRHTIASDILSVGWSYPAFSIENEMLDSQITEIVTSTFFPVGKAETSETVQKQIAVSHWSESTKIPGNGQTENAGEDISPRLTKPDPSAIVQNVHFGKVVGSVTSAASSLVKIPNSPRPSITSPVDVNSGDETEEEDWERVGHAAPRSRAPRKPKEAVNVTTPSTMDQKSTSSNEMHPFSSVNSSRSAMRKRDANNAEILESARRSKKARRATEKVRG